MPIPNHSFHITLTPSGLANSRFPDGNDGSASIPLVWAAIPSSLGNQEGTPVSINLRTYLTEPGSPAASLAIVGALPAGWSLVGDTLQFSGTGVGSAAIQVSATRLSFTATSGFFTVESIPNAAADNVPPTIPTGLTASLIAGPAVSLSWDASSDVKTPAVTASGLKDYQVTQSLPIGSPVAAPSHGLSLQLGLTTIGAPTPAVSGASQTGPDYTFTAGGDASALTGSSDALCYQCVQVTGDFTLTCVVSLASGGAAARAGIMARASMAPNAAFVMIAKAPDASGGVVSLSYRSATGAAVQAGASSGALLADETLRLNRTGDVFAVDYWNGSAWARIGQVNIGMTDPIYIGLAANSGAAAASISPTWRQMNLQNIAGSSYTDSAVAAGNSYSYTVTARDVNGNVSGPSDPVSILIPAPASTPGFPRLAAHANVASSIGFQSSAFQTYCTYMNQVVMGVWDGWQAGKPMTFAQIVDGIHASSKWASGTKVLQYVNAYRIAGTIANYSVLTANNWLLRATFPSGALVTNSSGLNIANHTAGGPTDGGGRTCQMYQADYIADWQYNGGAAGLDIYTNAPNPNLDGTWFDDLTFESQNGGDYNRDGVNDNNSATASSAMRAGIGFIFNRLKAAKPGKNLQANLSQIQSHATPSEVAELAGILKGGGMEGMLGVSWATESFSTWAAMMADYADQIAFCTDETQVYFMHSCLSKTGKDPYRSSTAFQALRYGLASCLMGNAAYCPCPNGAADVPTTSNAYDGRWMVGFWADEFAVSPGTNQCLAYASAGPGLGWLGDPIDAPFPAVWTQGLRRRKFRRRDNGKEVWVILNPKGNAAQSVVIPQNMQYLQGVLETAVNNGAPISSGSSILVPINDARFLVQP